MTVVTQARAAAVYCEAKKDGLRQTQEGLWKVTFTVSPLDMPASLMGARPGTRYMVALVEIGDDERPVTRQSGEASGDVSQPRQPRTEKPQRDPTSGRPDRVTQWFGIACNTPKFQAWCREHFGMSAEVDRDVAAELVRGYCGVKSRGEFATDPEARQKALDLMADYDRAIGNMAEDRS